MKRPVLMAAWIGFGMTAAVCAQPLGIDPSEKFAYVETAGWINHAPAGSGVAVHFDGRQGYLSGHAWGENIGWIKFGDHDGGPYDNTSATNWGVNLDANGRLSGFAWSENAGWIVWSTATHQASIDLADGRFSGYAWSEGLGWIRFRGPATNYAVRALAFIPGALGTPAWWLNVHGVGELDDEGDGVPAWQEYIADTNPNNPTSFFRLVSIGHHPAPTVQFQSSAQRYYSLQRRDPSGVADVWMDVPGQTNVAGIGALMSLNDAAGPTSMLYRVGVKVLP